MKQAYKEQNFRKSSLKQIELINAIIKEYSDQGYRLTVRQLYYQLVARGVIENTVKSYKTTTDLMNNARLAGLMDWEAIEDRTRSFIRRSHWTSPGQIVQACAEQYHEDLWRGQDTRVFVIVEKEALAGVLERVCTKMDIPLLAARGYPSATVLREFVISDLYPAFQAERNVVILHLGDHDPSGIDMTRDLQERIAMFSGQEADWMTVERIALSMDQIEELKPPPNPAKDSDSRFDSYRRLYGDESWELDAINPKELESLVRTHAEKYIDVDLLNQVKSKILKGKEVLRKIAQSC